MAILSLAPSRELRGIISPSAPNWMATPALSMSARPAPPTLGSLMASLLERSPPSGYVKRNAAIAVFSSPSPSHDRGA